MMPVTLPLKKKEYVDQDIQKILGAISQLPEKLGSSDEDIVFLRRFLRSTDTHILIKIFKRLCMVECKNLRPVTRRAVTLAADTFCEIRQNSQNAIARELLQVMSKPHFQALLYTHDKVAGKDFEPSLAPITYEIDNGVDNGAMKIVQLIKNEEPLGVTICLNESTGGLEIARLFQGGAAQRSGLIHVGDEVREVNNIDIRGLRPEHVVQILSEMAGPVSLKLSPGINSQSCLRQSQMRVRALFNYNPNEDELSPCPEAGLAFRKRDILHIVCQDDPVWWQARREGDPLFGTGLIPSKTLQESRKELIRHYTCSQRSDSPNRPCPNPHSHGVCRFSPKSHRCKRIRKTMYHAVQNGEYDTEEIPTYEEVGLDQPTPGRYRPIVLIGPPGVGRNELRRRLLASRQDHYEEVVPFTSRTKKAQELNGKEYNFVTREEMEKGIMNQKFVEHGEYMGNLYGTTSSSIKSVINRGKVCVLYPYTQALKFLRTPDIKPYIIFIKPPSLETLRQARITGDAMNTTDRGIVRPFKESEFADMIDTACKMEQKYGHLFDSILVNKDITSATNELIDIALRVETEPLWVPIQWLH